MPSIHAMGVAGPTVVLLYVFGLWGVLLGLLLPLVIWSRVYLKKHTLAQVLVAWNVPNKLIEEFSSVIDSLDEVSHGYERARYPEWNYNVYTMIHGHSERECRETVARIASALGLSDYALLFTRRELEKYTLDVPALLARD